MKKNGIMFLGMLCSMLFLVACGQKKDNVVVLRVANCEEYIDEGSWSQEDTIELEDGTEIFGKNSMVEDFEQWYEDFYGEKVKVEYSTYGTNEELYNQMTLGNVFDLVCPSEYMVMKLMGEERLQPLSEEFFDTKNENNYYIKGVSPYIKSVFDTLYMNGEKLSIYSAGYMWGTMGIVYNPAKVSEKDTIHWNMLLDDKYSKRITMKDSVRDSYFIALGILHEKELLDTRMLQSKNYQSWLSEMMNRTDQETVDQVENILSDMRKNAYSLETDSGKADMVTGKVVANMQWSGDAVYTLDQAEEDGVELCYAVPEECSNLWFDGFCMMKNGIEEDGRKQQVAEAFINFLSRPDNVIRNMYYIGYTSVISGGDSDLIFQYADYCYGSEEEKTNTIEYSLEYFFGKKADGEKVLTVDCEQMKRQLFAQYPPEDVLQRCAVMKCFDTDANQRISRMWMNIRCFSF